MILTRSGGETIDAHFAVFPLSLCWNPVLASCPPDGVVLDPFAGSGTVGEAVMILNILGKRPEKEEVKTLRKSLAEGNKPLTLAANRKYILVDINPQYCHIMRKRLEPYDKILKTQTMEYCDEEDCIRER